MTLSKVSQPQQILILEDDVDSLNEIAETLSEEGFHILPVDTAEAMWFTIEKQPIDLFLIDLNIPDGNGLTIVKHIREKSDVGIIIISGKTSEIDRVVGLEIGADDYITKPFSPRELIARVRSVLRRTQSNTYSIEPANPAEQIILEFSGWAFNLGAHHIISPNEKIVDLTTAEFELLRAFVEAPNRVLSRDFLIDRVHGNDRAVYDRSIDGLVSRLRKKLKQTGEIAPIIKTIRGIGYMFVREKSRC